jgi:hypothetical protein
MFDFIVHLTGFQSTLYYLHSRLFSRLVYPLSCGGIPLGENASGKDPDYDVAGGDAGGSSGSAVFANRIG